MPVQSARASAITPHSALRQQRLDVQLRQLEFSALLHRKLDVDRLFECLLSEGQVFVAFDGLKFDSPSSSIRLVMGLTRQHRMSFELRLGERVLGEISLMRAAAFNTRDERNAERLVESLVYPLNNALEHHRVLIKSMTDAPTGLRNQKALDQLLPREIRLSRRLEQPLSMLLISVDYLESISEHHGADVGEQAWLSVADTLTARLRQSDLIFRTDADAFCIVLNQTNLDGALILAERLRQEVDRCVSYDNVQFVLTASAGVTELSASDDSTCLMERVQHALVVARQAGRNQVRAIAATEPADGTDPDAA